VIVQYCGEALIIYIEDHSQGVIGGRRRRLPPNDRAGVRPLVSQVGVATLVENKIKCIGQPRPTCRPPRPICGRRSNGDRTQRCCVRLSAFRTSEQKTVANHGDLPQRTSIRSERTVNCEIDNSSSIKSGLSKWHYYELRLLTIRPITSGERKDNVAPSQPCSQYVVPVLSYTIPCPRKPAKKPRTSSKHP
jgi:hypothetical protein